MTNKKYGYLALFLVAIIWGVTYVAQTEGGQVGTFTFNTLCSLFSFISLYTYAVVAKIRFDKLSVQAGLLCGVILFVAMTFQQYGVINSTVGKSGFITALYIVFVPIIENLSGKKLNKRLILGIILAVIGLFFLCVDEKMSIQIGDYFLLLCAFFYAIQIKVIDKYCKESNPVVMVCFQFVTVGILSAVLMFCFEKNATSTEVIISNIVPILFAGVVGNGIAYTLQMIGQRQVDAVRCSIILCLESPFSVFAGIVLMNQIPTLKESIGCLFMFISFCYIQKE